MVTDGQGTRIPDLLLSGLYLFFLLSLVSQPVRHGSGWMGNGMGGGMGTAISLSAPSLLILFSLLIIIHLLSLVPSPLPWHLVMAGGLGMILSATLCLSLLFFVQPSGHLLESAISIPSLVYAALLGSFLLGLYRVIRLVRGRRLPERAVIQDPGSLFPLPESRYRNVRLLAEGGVGLIWYAEQVDDDLPVVVKVPRHDDEKTGISFMQEISVWKDLDHPHIATVITANILPFPYIVTEYLPGSLAEREKPVPAQGAVWIIRCVVSALVYAHERGVAHCDIKPSNILLTREGIPRLTDWGLARTGSPRWSVSGFSPRYAAPEQMSLSPACGFATDIWQIGMVFAELLTGRADVPSGTEPIFSLPGNAACLPVILRCLAADPAFRYSSATLLLNDLDRLISLMPDR